MRGLDPAFVLWLRITPGGDDDYHLPAFITSHRILCLVFRPEFIVVQFRILCAKLDTSSALGRRDPVLNQSLAAACSGKGFATLTLRDSAALWERECCCETSVMACACCARTQ